MIHQNIRGLSSNFLSLQNLISTAGNIDIISLSETHIVRDAFDDNNDLYILENHMFLKKNRKNGQGGGIAFYIKDGIKCNRRIEVQILIFYFKNNWKKQLMVTMR